MRKGGDGGVVDEAAEAGEHCREGRGKDYAFSFEGGKG